jgi:hypothetical protein
LGVQKATHPWLLIVIYVFGFQWFLVERNVSQALIKILGNIQPAAVRTRYRATEHDLPA